MLSSIMILSLVMDNLKYIIWDWENSLLMVILSYVIFMSIADQISLFYFFHLQSSKLDDLTSSNVFNSISAIHILLFLMDHLSRSVFAIVILSRRMSCLSNKSEVGFKSNIRQKPTKNPKLVWGTFLPWLNFFDNNNL